MKGRAPSADQRRYWSLLAERVGCIACYRDTAGYQRNHRVSIHHVAGRTSDDAHWLVLPLCASHHQDGTGAPGMVAVHPWKARFEKLYGKQSTLVRDCAMQLQDMGEQIPQRMRELLEAPA